MTTLTRTSRGINAQGQIVETVVEYDPAKAEVARQRRELRDAQQTAASEQAALEQQAIPYFIRGESFPTELKDYHAALGEVLTASVGDVVSLPVKPDVLSVAPAVKV